ncbi:uncharacterized protein EV422DRAFT_417220 [Fimicolochytrium jonesii]|uniref:uncharacterized protein n=1 Tax=Fimicolochytrium jonesii TaxID=1396493 RepID=UPI0022FDE47C|nr:uncharacterized protein EV422DRAFT_417220 [Fimicolochytrium jonesii]KAI8822106.1 hypothetical protein EV422DRAFT_417220 [Fimicolochytrium jonesii]
MDGYGDPGWFSLKAGVGEEDGPARANAGIIVPLATFFSVGGVCFMIFCFVRNVFRDIYSPRRFLAGGRPPRLPDGIFAWVPILLRMPESLLIAQVGLDGVMLLRYFKMGAHLFGVLSLFGLLIVAPVNYYANPPSYVNSTGILFEDIILPAMTVENVPKQSPALWVHLFFTWFFSMVAYSYLISYYRGHVDLKLKSIEHVLRHTRMSKIELRSIIVFGIPTELRHEVDLAAFFEGLGIGNVENVVICRKWSHLRAAVQKRAHYLTQLEKVYAQVMRNLGKRPHRFGLPFSGNGASSVNAAGSGGTLDYNNGGHSLNGSDLRGGDFGNDDDPLGAARPLLSEQRRFSAASDSDGSVFEIMSRLDAIDPRNRPTHRTGFAGLMGPRVDSAEYYAGRFQEWDRKVARFRKFPEASPATSAGFVTFESPESAILASQVLVHKRPFACMARLAPEPRDVYWDNLSAKGADSYIKMLRSVFVTGTLVLLVFFSTLIVSTITALISLDTFPNLKDFLKELGPGWTQFIQGVIPAVVTATWTSSLPAVLILLAQVQGLEAQSWIDASVLSKYFFYQIWNILFVQTVATKIWQTRYDIIRHGPGEIIDILGSLVPSGSSVQINYVMLLATAAYPAQLLLVGPLILTWLYRALSWRQSTPRQISDAYYPSVLTSINYGIVYAVPILVFCVGITYAPVAPLILPFCALFYIIAYFVYKYILLYVNIPRYETGGKHAPQAVRRSLAGIFIMQLTMMGCLALKAGSGITSKPDKDASQEMLRSDDKSRLLWSGYVQMVVGVAPLLLITSLVYWWFQHGFEKIVTHIPLEIVGGVAKDLAKQRNDEAATRRNRMSVGGEDHGKELATVSAPAPNNKSNGTTSRANKRVSIKATRGRVKSGSVGGPEGRHPTEHICDGDGVDDSRDSSADMMTPPGRTRPSAADSASSPGANPRTPTNGGSTFGGRKSSSPFRLGILAETSSAHDDDDMYRYEDGPSGEGTFESTADTVSEYTIGIEDPQTSMFDDPSFLTTVEDSTPTPHLEPPMTRVAGILDAPFISASAIVPAGDEADNATKINEHDDLQLHTYVHPALIGRLPVPWVPGATQPRRCREAREEMSKSQRNWYSRIVGRQRVGVWELGADDETVDIASQRSDSGGLRRRGRRNSLSVVRKVMSFVDGVTSWAHLSMS